jgi:hypothetical protein
MVVSWENPTQRPSLSLVISCMARISDGLHHVSRLTGVSLNVVANYEIRAECSVIDDGHVLRISHPRGLYRARLENIPRDSYEVPFLLALHLYFEAPDLQGAKEVGDDLLADFLNILAFTTAGRYRKHRTRQIVELEMTSDGMHSLLMWGDSIAHEDPIACMDETTIKSVEKLLEFDYPGPVRRALRWYRLGVNSTDPDDQFMSFWFALEILAEHQKSTEKVPDRCPRCKVPLFCEACKEHPVHRPYVKQAIVELIKRAEPSYDDAVVQRLDKSRNGLMHGSTLSEVAQDLGDSQQHIVDVLGQLVFKALAYQFPPDIIGSKVIFNVPSTYVHYSMEGVARMQTVIPEAGGEFDLSFKGMTMKLDPDGPPQSARPTYIRLKPDQIDQLRRSSYLKSAGQELLQRVVARIRRTEDGAVALVLATEMREMRAAIIAGSQDDWLAVLREVVDESC